MPQLTIEEERASTIVDILARLRRITDERLADNSRTRANANQKRKGVRAIGLGDLPWLCDVLHVDPTLFVIPVEEWPEYGLMGLSKAEWDYLRAELLAAEQTPRIDVACAVMSGRPGLSTVRGGRPGLCVTNPTASAISMYTPVTAGPAPTARGVCITRRGVGRAAERVGQR